MRCLCLFLRCRWIHHMNVLTDVAPVGKTHAHSQAGLYQCARCKAISIGAARDSIYAQPLVEQAAVQLRGFWSRVWSR